MNQRAARSLRRYTSVGFWDRRAHHQAVARGRSAMELRVRERVASARASSGIIVRLTRKSATLVLSTLAGIVVLEVLAAMAAHGGFLPDLVPGVSLLTPAEGAGAGTFAGATLAAAATLLGLHFATVGVVASTVYRDVPSDVRSLFIREKRGELYIRALVVILVGSLLILAAAAVGYEVTGLTLSALMVVATLTGVWLTILGRELFAFFDPTQLTGAVVRRINSAMTSAADSGTRESRAAQEHAQRQMWEGLNTYRALVSLMSASALRDPLGPLTIVKQLTFIMQRYSAVKESIPMDSKWWRSAPAHRNYLSTPVEAVKMTVTVGKELPAPPQPNHLWVEQEAAQVMRAAMDAVVSSDNPDYAVSISSHAVDLVQVYSQRLQLAEAQQMERMWVEAMHQLLKVEAGATDIEAKRVELIAAAFLVRPLTAMYIGVLVAAENFTERDVEQDCHRALARLGGRVRQGYPAEARKFLERVRIAISREKRIEGHRVTPDWWVHHYLAKEMAGALVEAESQVLGAIEMRVFATLAELRQDGRSSAAAAVGLSGLELLNRINLDAETVQRAHERLKRLRNPHADTSAWPDERRQVENPSTLRSRLLAQLAAMLPTLDATAFDERLPDQYGQIYHHIVAGAFEAIIEDDDVTSAALLEGLLGEVPRVVARRAADQGKEADPRLGYGIAEPFLVMMELSGYALVLEELGANSWTTMRRVWDRILTANPGLIAPLLIAAELPPDPSDVLARGERSYRFEQAVEKRGFDIPTLLDYDWESETSEHPGGPILSVYQTGASGYLTQDVHRVFAAECLKNHLPEGVVLSGRSRDIDERLAKFRKSSDSE